MSINIKLIDIKRYRQFEDGITPDTGEVISLDEKNAKKFLGDFLALDIDNPDSFKSFCMRYGVQNTFKRYFDEYTGEYGYKLLDALDEYGNEYVSDFSLEEIRKVAAAKSEIKQVQQQLQDAEFHFYENKYLPRDIFDLFMRYVWVEKTPPKSGARRDTRVALRGDDVIGAAVLSFIVLFLEKDFPICYNGAIICENCGAPLPYTTRGRYCSSCREKSSFIGEIARKKKAYYARASRRGLTKNPEFRADWKSAHTMTELDDLAIKWEFSAPSKRGRRPKH